MTHNSEREMLQKNLMDTLQIRYLNFYWLTPSFVAFFFLVILIGASLQSSVDKNSVLLFATFLLFLCGYQAIILIWLRKLRKTLSTATPVQARNCLVKNIIFSIASFVLFPICGILLQNPFLFLGGMVISASLWVPLAKVNRLVKLLYFQTQPSRERYEESSPCPNIFREMAFFKSLWILPLLLFALSFLFFLTIKFYFKAQIPFEAIWYTSGACGLVGLVITILIAGNFWFIKQTATPSIFQRIIRNLTFPKSRGQVSYLGQYLPKYERVAYKWWLSHPGQPWPENMTELCKHVDTTSFDWQNPKEWPF